MFNLLNVAGLPTQLLKNPINPAVKPAKTARLLPHDMTSEPSLAICVFGSWGHRVLNGFFKSFLLRASLTSGFLEGLLYGFV